MGDKQEDDEADRDPNKGAQSTELKEKGYSLNPPFLQLVLGHSANCWLNIRQDAFSEFQVGSDVQISCLTSDVASNKSTCGLESHPTQENVLRAIWKITAKKVTSTTGLRVRIGSIEAVTMIEVFENEAEKFSHVTKLMFAKKQYRITANKKRNIILMAPTSLVSGPTRFDIECNSPDIRIGGKRILEPSKVTRIARCVIPVFAKKTGTNCEIIAKVNEKKASAKLIAVEPRGSGR